MVWCGVVSLHMTATTRYCMIFCVALTLPLFRFPPPLFNIYLPSSLSLLFSSPLHFDLSITLHYSSLHIFSSSFLSFRCNSQSYRLLGTFQSSPLNTLLLVIRSPHLPPSLTCYSLPSASFILILPCLLSIPSRHVMCVRSGS